MLSPRTEGMFALPRPPLALTIPPLRPGCTVALSRQQSSSLSAATNSAVVVYCTRSKDTLQAREKTYLPGYRWLFFPLDLQ